MVDSQYMMECSPTRRRAECYARIIKFQPHVKDQKVLFMVRIIHLIPKIMHYEM